MLRMVIAGLRVRIVPTLLTGGAIALSVAFFTGTLVYGDTSRTAYLDDVARPASGVDVAVNPPSASGYDPGSQLDEAALRRVQAVPGVAQADGRVVTHLPVLDRDGRVLHNDGRVGWAVSLPRSPRMSPLRVVTGRLPGSPGEATLDLPTATRLRAGIGDYLMVLDPAGNRHQLTLVGTVDFGVVPMFYGWSVVGLTDTDLATLTRAGGRYSSIVVAGAAGIGPADLRHAVQAAVTGTSGTTSATGTSATGTTGAASATSATVVTGDELRASLARETTKYASGFQQSLVAGSLVALVVAGLVVANTLRILVAHRGRELALLRTVGASRRQVFGVVAAEAATIGALASAAGAALSLGVAWLVVVARDRVGDAESAHALVVAPAPLLAGLLLGVLTTVVAAVRPALAASRVAPLAALRSATGDPPARSPYPRGVAAAGLALGGGAVTASGTGAGFDGTTRVVAGAMVVFVGLVVLLPLVVVPLTRLAGVLPSLLLGLPARLAVRNAGRSRHRLAAATAALMIGMMLVSLFSVVFATARDQADLELAENFPVDFSVRPIATGTTTATGTVAAGTEVGEGDSRLPDQVVTELQGRPELSTVVRSRKDLLWVDGTTEPLAASTLAPDQTAFVPDLAAGTLDALGDHRLAMRAEYAHQHGIIVGDTIVGDTYHHRRYAATVVALFDDAPVEGPLLLSWTDYEALFGSYGDQLLIRRAPGVSVADARAAIDGVLTRHPLISVTSQAERSEALALTLRRRLAQFGALLGVTVVVAVLGIVGTLALTGLARTRESATLRALGMARWQLGRVLVLESLLTAVVGAGLGIGSGVAAGWVTASSLIDAYGHGVPSVPVLPLLGGAGLATAAAVLGALVPAGRVARTDVIAALTD